MTFRAFVLGVVLAVSGAAAQAATMQATMTGLTTLTQDEVFGTDPNASLAQAFSFTVVYDTSLGARTTNPGQSDFVETDSVSTPILSASLTINGTSFDFPVLPGVVGVTQVAFFFALGLDPGGNSSSNGFAFFLFGGFNAPGLLDQPFSATAASGQFFEGISNGQVAGFVRRETPGSGFSGSFSVDSLTVTEVAPIPLPASALMLLAGIGGLGAFRAARRLRASV